MEKAIQVDKQKDTIKKLEELDESNNNSYKWDHLKLMKKNYQHRQYKFEKKQGIFVSKDHQAEMAAEYLETEQWGEPQINLADNISTTQLAPPNIIPDTPFTEDELDNVLNKLKNNKTPGPDNTTT